MEVAEKLLEGRDYLSLMAVLAGLNEGPVYRLKYTLDEVPDKIKEVFIQSFPFPLLFPRPLPLPLPLALVLALASPPDPTHLLLPSFALAGPYSISESLGSSLHNLHV